MKSRVYLSAVLAVCLAGCVLQPGGTTPAPTPAVTAAPAPTAKPMPTTDPAALPYDEMRSVAVYGTTPTTIQEGYFTVSQDGKWGLIRADGTEVLPCLAEQPVSNCGNGQHWMWTVPGMDWEEVDARTAQLEAEGERGICPGHGGGSFFFFYDLDVADGHAYDPGALRAYQSSDGPGDIVEVTAAMRETFGGLLPAYYAYEEGEPGDPVYPSDPDDIVNSDGTRGIWIYAGRNVPVSLPGARMAGFFFNEALAPVQMVDGWTYVDREGNFLPGGACYDPTYGTSPTFTGDSSDTEPYYAAHLQNGYAAVRRGDAWGLLDATGTEVVPCAQPGVAWEGTTLWVKSDGGWRQQELPVTVDRSYQISLDDGSPLPTAALPLEYRGYYAGQTWEEVAALTGFDCQQLQTLNPNIQAASDGTLSPGKPLLLSNAYMLPQSRQALVTVRGAGLPAPYYARSFRVPASLDDEAAVTLARAYFESWACGQGLDKEPSQVDGYSVVTGGRFDGFDDLESYFAAIFTGEALDRWVEPWPWRGERPTAYYAEGENGELLVTGYAFDSVIPQSGYTHTEPQADSNGGLNFAGICIIAHDEEGTPLPESAAQLLFAPVQMTQTAEGWRVAEYTVPF